MARKFLSLLGTVNYEPCLYDTKDKTQTRYIQEALTKEFCNEWDENDEIIVFLTKEARRKNWYNESVEEQRLSCILKKNHKKLKVKDVDIPSGKNEDEFWDIFDTILSNISDGDEITFDITHSLRSIPMLVLVILNYAKTIKDIRLKGIYYGAYDAKIEEDGEQIVPIFNLTSFDNLLKWSEAVNSFLKYGNSEEIKDLSMQDLIGRIKNGDMEAQKIRSFVDRLNDFTNNMYTCRGKLVEKQKNSCKKSVNIAYRMLKESLDNILEEENCSLKPLKPLLNKVAERISEFSSTDNFKTGLAVVKWSIDNNLIQQGYTALDETIKTYLCQKYNLNDADHNNREEIANKALNIKMRGISQEHWDIKDEYKSLVYKMVNETDSNLASLCSIIRTRRNDINHFGFKDNPVDYMTMKADLRNCYDSFKKYIDNTCDNKE